MAKKKLTSTLASALVAGLVLSTPLLAAAGPKEFAVTITNVTRGQTFTPILVASHMEGVKLFTPGMPASPELAALAEGGDVATLGAALLATGDVLDVADSGGMLGPGESVTVMVETTGKYNHVSVASMLLPTNDGFFAVNGMKGPSGKKTVMVMAPAWDAGSEPNDELCASIPGPFCLGAPGSPPDPGDEGFVHVHAGIHGIGDLDPAMYDWRSAVASISITRMK